MFQTIRKKDMDLLIMDILRDNRLHEYDMGEETEKLYGMERLSSGLIYLLLFFLGEKKFDKGM